MQGKLSTEVAEDSAFCVGKKVADFELKLCHHICVTSGRLFFIMNLFLHMELRAVVTKPGLTPSRNISMGGVRYQQLKEFFK